MSEMSDIIKASLDGIKSFADSDISMGNVINTPSGVTVIPISKVSVGFAGGGLDYGAKKLTQSQNFGGGSGTGISITPMAFLTIGKDASINLIPINSSSENVDKLISLLDRAPEIAGKVKSIMS